MATPSVNYTVLGTNFSIPANEQEQTDITAFMINALAALEGHTHDGAGRGLAVASAPAAAAGTLTGATLAAGVLASSLTSVGTLAGLTVGGDLTVTGTARRILADLTNATETSRLMFQTSTSNSNSFLGLLPSGSATAAQYRAYNGSDPANAGYVTLTATTAGASINSNKNGTGTAQDLQFLLSSTAALTLAQTTLLASFAGGINVASGKNVQVGGAAARATTEPTNALNLFNGTAPVGTLANGVSLYAAAGELRVMDAGGTSTLLSPHDDDGNWVFDSTDTTTGRRLVIDVEKLLRFLNDHHGLDFVREEVV